MRRVMIGVVAAAVVVALIVVMIGRGRNAARRPEAPSQAVQGPTAIEAEGRVVPVRGVTLSLASGGTVASVPVVEGQGVQAGQLLLRLSSADQAEAAEAQARAAARRARAYAAELRAGPRPQEIDVARGAVAAAQARLDQLRAGARTEERAQMQWEVEQAQAVLRAADDDLRRADQLLATGAVSQQFVVQARANRDRAAAALASIEERRRLVQAGSRPEELRAAEADLSRAAAQLELVRAGARPQALAAAAADVAAADAAVRQAQAALAQTELRSPITGTVTFIGVRAGEFAAPGITVAAVADLSTWRIETTDLMELHVARIRPGDAVKASFDGIPGLELAGKVASVERLGVMKQGDVTYKVVITLDRQDVRLHWNMTAAVAIEAEDHRAMPQN
jgi:HlyD family secretion protein